MRELQYWVLSTPSTEIFSDGEEMFCDEPEFISEKEMPELTTWEETFWLLFASRRFTTEHFMYEQTLIEEVLPEALRTGQKIAALVIAF